MAYTYIYEQDGDDFSCLGLCGRLSDSLCRFEEIANGMSELTLEHPIDSEGRFALLVPGRILKATVPVRNIPELDPDTLEYVTTVQKWYVRSDATRLERTVFNKRDDQVTADKDNADEGEDTKKYDKKKLKILKKGTRVTVVADYGDLHPEYRIRVGKVTGYIDKTALRDKVTSSYSGAAGSAASLNDFYERAEPSWKCKEQLFRIYDVVRQDDKVVAMARHIFYDNAYTLSTYNATGNPSLSTVLSGIRNNRCGSCQTVFHTNVKGTRSGAHYENKNIVEVLLDPEEGVAARWGADLIRDNYDCYLIDDAGYDRGVCLEYGHDLLGVEYSVNWENVVTHVRPVGETEAGKPLYLTGSKGMVVSSKADRYPFAHVAVLPVSEARVQKGVMTTAEARSKLQAAANALLASGVDEPEVNVAVRFAQLGETEEYAAYKGLKNLFLFDYVRVRNNRLKIDARARVTRIVWDCRLERLDEVELGSVRDLTPKVAGFQLASGINGGKIAPGTITSAGLEDDIINVRHMQADSVNAQAIQARQITSEHIAVGGIKAENIEAQAITTEKLAANTISAGMLSAMNAVIQQLDAGHVEAQTLEAAFATLAVLEAGSASFDRATVAHLVAEALNLQFGTAGNVFIQNLQVAYAQMVSAAIGNLCLKASDGHYYNIDVGTDGTVTATQATVTEGEITAGQTAGGRAILETTITAEQMNTGSLLATYALVNRIDAARIDVDTLVSRQAFIDKLNTSLIQNNQFIQMVVGDEVETAMVDATPAVLRIDSSRGTVFKDNQVNTVLSVIIYYGPNRIEDTTSLRTHFGNGAYLQWEWLRLDDERFGILSGSDSRLSDGGFRLTLTPTDVDTKVTFRCSLITS